MGGVASRCSPPARAASATTRCSFRKASSRARHSCRPSSRIGSATAARRSRSSYGSWSTRRGECAAARLERAGIVERAAAAAAVAVRAPPVVRAQVPVLRFQFATLHGELPEERVHRGAAARPRRQLPSGVGAGEIISVFFGGGTPSLFSPAALARLARRDLRAALDFAADVEITLEANPGTIEHGRFADYRDAGINRVSLGAQSFADAAARSGSAAFTRAADTQSRGRGAAGRRASRTSISI